MNIRRCRSIAGLAVVAGAMGSAAGCFGQEEACGDGTCGLAEVDEGTCPIDCGPPCGNGICEEGETAGSCSEDCIVPTSLDLRLSDYNFAFPARLGLANGIVSGSIESEELNLLVRVRDLAATPTIEVAAGDAPTATGRYLFPVTGVSGAAAALDAEERRLATLTPLRMTVEVRELVNGVDIGLSIELVEATLDLHLTPDLRSTVSIDDPAPSELRGHVTVEYACATWWDFGGALVNLLDTLDGGPWGSPALDPGMCAAASGPEHVGPDADLDGDGVADAYSVVVRLAAVPVTFD